MVCKGTVIARLPPSVSNTTNPRFVSTPRGYFSGLYYETYSSTLDSNGLRNVQLISVYNSTADVTNDLTSYQVGSCPHIYTTFATDADTASQADNYPFRVPGTNQTFVTDVLAYGLDTDCHRYIVSFGTDPRPGLTITSQVQNGPTAKTKAAIKKALIDLGSRQVTEEVNKVGKIPDDGSRSGLPDFVCGTACLTNKNNYNGTCASK